MLPNASLPPTPVSAPSSNAPPPKPRENLWINLICNALLPGFLLTQLSKSERLGPVWGLVVALSVPLSYGIYDLIRRRTWNVFSIVGLAGTLVTGILGLMKAGNIWIAAKEAAVPALLGLAIPLTLKTRQPLVRTLIYNDQVLDTDRIGRALVERNVVPGFDALLRWASWVLAATFLASAVVNFFLAYAIVTAPPGTSENIAQLGKLNWLSWPVIFVPSMAVMMFVLFRLLKRLSALTGLTNEELFHPRS